MKTPQRVHTPAPPLTSLTQATTQHAVVCIGNFDGVHLGHKMLLSRMQRLATELTLPSLIVSFTPPAKIVFQGGKFLTSGPEKAHLIEQFSPSEAVFIPFSFEYAKTDKQVFLAELAALKPKVIIVGEDFRFGHKRLGSLDDLAHITPKLEVFGMRQLEGKPIKSSLIRSLINESHINKAKTLLGHDYFALGPVVKGQQRGRTINFPTANIATDPQKLLPYGVFAVQADTPYGTFGGMANVGPRPSFPEDPPALEVHLFEFDKEVYDEQITVHFVAHLRNQIKFTGLQALQEQLKQDAQNAQKYLLAYKKTR